MGRGMGRLRAAAATAALAALAALVIMKGLRSTTTAPVVTAALAVTAALGVFGGMRAGMRLAGATALGGKDKVEYLAGQGVGHQQARPAARRARPWSKGRRT
jgi:hypothetical protein